MKNQQLDAETEKMASAGQGSELDFSSEIPRAQVQVQDGQLIEDRRRQVRVDRRAQTVEQVRAETAARLQAEQEASRARAEAEKLKGEIESRSRQLASSKIQEMEQEINNTFTLMVEHELLQAEQDKVQHQQQMIEAARLSPIFEPMRELDFFRDFSLAELAEVLHIGAWAEREGNAVLLQTGSDTSAFFVLMDGQAAVLREGKLIGSIEAGESFGEGFYLMGEPASHYASVVANSHVEYLEFATEPLESASLEVRYQLARALARSQTRRFRRANELIGSLRAEGA